MLDFDVSDWGAAGNLEKTLLLREEDKMTIITRRMMMIVMFDG